MVPRAATAEDPNELPAGGDLQQGALAVLPILPEPAAGQPIILPLLAQAGLARAGGPSVCDQRCTSAATIHAMSFHLALTREWNMQIVQRSPPLGWDLKIT